MSFEQEKLLFQHDGKTIKVIPDYSVIYETGQVGCVEAKPDIDLSSSLREKLSLNKELIENSGRRYDILYAADLEENGFLETITFLRRYSRLEFSEKAIKRAKEALADDKPKTLDEYRVAADDAGLPYSLVFHMLYFGHLPLKFVPFVIEELKLCHV